LYRLAGLVEAKHVLEREELAGDVKGQPHPAVPHPAGGAYLAVPVFPRGGRGRRPVQADADAGALCTTTGAGDKLCRRRRRLLHQRLHRQVLRRVDHGLWRDGGGGTTDLVAQVKAGVGGGGGEGRGAWVAAVEAA